MKIKVVGNMLHVIMDVSTDDMVLAKNFDSNALTVFEDKDGEKQEVFKVSADTFGLGSDGISKYGAEFTQNCVLNENTATTANDYKFGAQIAIKLPPFVGLQPKKEFVAECYGVQLAHLRTIENQVKDALVRRDEFVQNITNEIEIENLEDDNNENEEVNLYHD